MNFRVLNERVIDVLVEIERRDVIKELEISKNENWLTVFKFIDKTKFERIVGSFISEKNTVFICCVMLFNKKLEMLISTDKEQIKKQVRDRTDLGSVLHLNTLIEEINRL